MLLFVATRDWAFLARVEWGAWQVRRAEQQRDRMYDEHLARGRHHGRRMSVWSTCRDGAAWLASKMVLRVNVWAACRGAMTWLASKCIEADLALGRIVWPAYDWIAVRTKPVLQSMTWKRVLVAVVVLFVLYEALDFAWFTLEEMGVVQEWHMYYDYWTWDGMHPPFMG